MHFGPASVTIYADGYTVASGMACDAEPVGTEDRDRRYLTLVTPHPLQVTCDACRATALFRQREVAYLAGGLVECPVEPDLVPHMRAAVFRDGGRFDREATLALRRFLCLPEDLPGPDLLAKVYAIEAAKQLRYAEMRVERIREGLAQAEADLAAMKRRKLRGAGE